MSIGTPHAPTEDGQRILQAMEACGHCVWDWDMLSGDCNYSPAWKALLGCEDAELSDRIDEWEQRIEHEDLLAHHDAVHRHAETGQVYRQEMQVRCQDGSLKWLVVRGQIIERTPDGQPRRMLGTATDISAWKRAERVPQETERRMLLAMDSVGDGVWDWDMSSDRVYYSPRWKALLGYADEEIGDTLDEWRRLILPEDADSTLTAIQRHIETGETFAVEFRARCKDGGIKWLLGRGKVTTRDRHGRPLRMIGTNTDITERKQADEELRRSEARFKLFSDVSPLAVAALDGPNHLIEYINPKGVELLGYTQEDLPDLAHWWSLAYPDPAYRQQVEEEWMRRVTPAVLHSTRMAEPMETEVACKDGSRKAMLWDFAYFGGKGIIYGLDLTARKQAERELLRVSDRLQVATQAAGIGIWDWDVIRDELVWDADMYRLYGIRGEDFGGAYDAWSRAIHPMDAPRAEQAIQAALRGEQEYAVEFRIIRPDGSLRHIQASARTSRNAQGEPLRMVGVNYDITERKLAEEELRSHRDNLEDLVAARTAEIREVNTALEKTVRELDLYRYILDKATVAIYLIDRLGRFVYVNECAVRHTQYTREMLLGMSVGDINPDHTEEDWIERWSRVQALPLSQLDVARMRHRRRDGSTFPVEIYAHNIQHDGHVYRLAMGVDITLQLAAEEALHLARKAAEAANQAKSEFLANMSHEIRTPMNAIIGLSHLTLKGEVSAQQRDYLQKILLSGRHLLGILNDILDFSKIEAGKLEVERCDFALQDVLENVSTLIGDKATGKGLRLIVEVADDVPPHLSGDSLRLGQILINYASNAVKFTERGEVRITARVDERGPDEVLLRFEVHDTGIGFTEAQGARLFQSFEQADSSTTRQYSGTGLGLAISKRLAELMGGEVGAHGVPGRGSSFWFTARLGIGSAGSRPAAGRADVLLSTLAGARVLLAEDNELNQQVAADLLRDAGMHVDVAGNGEAAIAMLGGGNPPYDIVLMDMQMPVMDGVTATREIRHLRGHAHLPIVAMTANVTREDRARCLDAGMSDFIAKPIEPAEMWQVLHKWMARRRPLRSPAAPGSAVSAPAAPMHPDIEGLDIAAGLRRVMGRTALYHRMLRMFVAGQSAAPQQMRDALAADDWQSAELLAHTLRGVAGNVGASAVQEHARMMELALRERGPEPRVLAMLETLGEALGRQIEAISAALPLGESPVEARGKPQVQASAAIVAELAQLLANDDARAAKLWAEHQGRLTAVLGDSHGRIDLAIAGFDYVSALVMIEAARR